MNTWIKFNLWYSRIHILGVILRRDLSRKILAKKWYLIDRPVPCNNANTSHSIAKLQEKNRRREKKNFVSAFLVKFLFQVSFHKDFSIKMRIFLLGRSQIWSEGNKGIVQVFGNNFTPFFKIFSKNFISLSNEFYLVSIDFKTNFTLRSLQ